MYFNFSALPLWAIPDYKENKKQNKTKSKNDLRIMDAGIPDFLNVFHRGIPFCLYFKHLLYASKFQTFKEKSWIPN